MNMYHVLKVMLHMGDEQIIFSKADQADGHDGKADADGGREAKKSTFYNLV
ncbi:hypothetical protein [sulfur-oxidizing endosymbiont of Gigantopelta aegis]|uniref:hypothetical protein n=1 Tax=sulfur-oxidizing endosymbiont of Gigantopelta aegis TaxID=2794934 RepID=UPI0018DD1868|nr:hypothetical protein [sulfur-oxidizing endosymbiont of Gigantopelta aegis]